MKMKCSHYPMSFTLIIEALRDRFVCGIMNSSICQRLLAERTLKLKTAINLAKTLINAEVEPIKETDNTASKVYY